MKEKITNPEFWPALGCKLVMTDKRLYVFDIVVAKDLICGDVFIKTLFPYVNSLQIDKFFFKKRKKYFESEKFLEELCHR